jgi:hypothetical protein
MLQICNYHIACKVSKYQHLISLLSKTEKGFNFLLCVCVCVCVCVYLVRGRSSWSVTGLDLGVEHDFLLRYIFLVPHWRNGR